MRKYVLFFIVFILSSASVYAQDSIAAKANYSFHSNQVNVTGTVPQDCEEVFMVVHKIAGREKESHKGIESANVRGKIIALRACGVSDGAYSASLSLKPGIDSGWYQVTVGLNGYALTDGASDVFYISSAAEREQSLIEFNSATVSTLNGLLRKYCEDLPILDVHIDNEFYLGYQNEILLLTLSQRDTLFGGRFESISDVAAAINYAVVLTRLNNAEQGTRAALLEENNEYFLLDLDGAFIIGKEEVCRLLFFQKEARNGKFLSLSGLRSAFRKALAVAELNKAASDGVANVVESYPDIFSLNYQGISKKDALRYLWDQGFTTPEEAVDAFDAAVGILKHASGIRSPGGGGVGSPVITRDVLLPRAENQPPLLPMETTGTFTDLEAFEWAREAINELYIRGVIQGYGEGEFRPEQPITREEYIKIIVAAFDLSAGEGNVSFSDVSEKDWYFPYVRSAVGIGIIKGLSDELFGVGMLMTREDASVIIARYLTENDIGFDKGRHYREFNDGNEISDYAAEAVRKLTEYGILSGRDGNVFSPRSPILRAEAAEMIYLVLVQGRGTR